MDINEFVMILADNYANYIQNNYPNLRIAGMNKKSFRVFSDYRWAIDELIDFVHDEVKTPDKPLPVYKYIEAVIQFEYNMDVFSSVNDNKRSLFLHARQLAEDVEDILNAMI